MNPIYQHEECDEGHNIQVVFYYIFINFVDIIVVDEIIFIFQKPYTMKDSDKIKKFY